MIIKLVLAAVVLYLLWSGFAQLKALPEKKRKQMLVRGVLWGALALLLLGAITGRAHWLGAVLAALIPLLRFGAGTLLRLFPFWLNRGGVVPFKTEYLDVKIELKTGRVTGFIRKGEFAERAFESLSPDEFKKLLSVCELEDKKASYLLKHFRPQHSQQSQSPPPDFGDPEYEEALQILGLKANPSREEIISAHKRLIHKLHPDRGGSDFLAARVNQARDVLLQRHT